MKTFGKWAVLLTGAFTISLLLVWGGWAAISTINGLAVAQSSTVWNNVKDASFGDNATNGVLVSNSYVYDGTNWDRQRSAAVGDNQTVGVPVQGLYGYDAAGTNWDRLRVDPNGALAVGALKETTATESQVSCTTTSGTIQASNTSRSKVHFLNQSAVDAYVCYAATCTTAAGMRFQENMGYSEDIYTGIITCITVAGTATVATKES